MSLEGLTQTSPIQTQPDPRKVCPTCFDKVVVPAQQARPVAKQGVKKPDVQTPTPSAKSKSSPLAKPKTSTSKPAVATSEAALQRNLTKAIAYSDKMYTFQRCVYELPNPTQKQKDDAETLVKNANKAVADATAALNNRGVVAKPAPVVQPAVAKTDPAREAALKKQAAGETLTTADYLALATTLTGAPPKPAVQLDSEGNPFPDYTKFGSEEKATPKEDLIAMPFKPLTKDDMARIEKEGGAYTPTETVSLTPEEEAAFEVAQAKDREKAKVAAASVAKNGAVVQDAAIADAGAETTPAGTPQTIINNFAAPKDKIEEPKVEDKKRTYLFGGGGHVGTGLSTEAGNGSAVSTWFTPNKDATKVVVTPGLQFTAGVGTTLKDPRFTAELSASTTEFGVKADWPCDCVTTAKITKNELNAGLYYNPETDGDLKPYLGVKAGVYGSRFHSGKSVHTPTGDVSNEPDGNYRGFTAAGVAGLDYVLRKKDKKSEVARFGISAERPLMPIVANNGASRPDIYKFRTPFVLNLGAKFSINQPKTEPKPKSLEELAKEPAILFQGSPTEIDNLDANGKTLSTEKRLEKVIEFSEPTKTKLTMFGQQFDATVRQNMIKGTFEYLSDGQWIPVKPEMLKAPVVEEKPLSRKERRAAEKAKKASTKPMSAASTTIKGAVAAPQIIDDAELVKAAPVKSAEKKKSGFKLRDLFTARRMPD